ncbi:MAG: MinD/ParA family protein [Bdellovibrionia bacterium]
MINSTRTISITSGKGGVGKTTLTANLALRLAATGSKVLILDGDFGMANVDIFFGIKPQGYLLEVIKGEKELAEIVTEVAPNVHLIPGGSGIVDYGHLNHFERRYVLESVSRLPVTYDYLLVDTAPGLAENVLFLNSAAQQCLVVLTPDPSSFADAYALIKVLNQKRRVKNFSIVCNQVVSEIDGISLYNKFQDVVGRFLNVKLDFLGSIPVDSHLQKATHQQRLIMRQDPTAVSSMAISRISNQIERARNSQRIYGGFEGFWEQVVGIA